VTTTLPRIRRSRFGGTLAEGILAVFISTMFLSVLPGFYFTSVKIWQRECGELEAVRSADFALKRMDEDVRNARSVAISSDGTMLTLTLPRQGYDAALGRYVNILDSHGWLMDGDRIEYSIADHHTSDGSDPTMHRRVIRADGTAEAPRLVANHVHPQVNPLDPATGYTTPVFAYDSDHRTLTVTVTAAETKPSAGTFGPTQAVLKCSRDGGQLVRIATEEHPEGEIRCSICGTDVETTAQIVTYQTRFMLRNR